MLVLLDCGIKILIFRSIEKFHKFETLSVLSFFFFYIKVCVSFLVSCFEVIVCSLLARWSWII